MSNYLPTASLSTYHNPTNLVVGTGLLLSLRTTGVNNGKYESYLDDQSIGHFLSCYLGDQTKAARININSGLNGFNVDGPGTTISRSYPLKLVLMLFCLAEFRELELRIY